MIDLQSYHADLVEKFEASEDSGDKMRRKAEKDRDYYDGKQWTEAEVKELKRRGQPAITQNMIKQKIDFLQGLERQQRTVPNALPRTPKHESDAHAASDALRFVADDNRYNKTRSKCWEDILKAGWGGVEVTVREKRRTKAELQAGTTMAGPQYEVVINRCQWDRMFWDPYSAEVDFSDAGYLGMVIWMDREEAVRRYGEAAGKVFDETVSSHSIGSTFDDKPYKAWVSTGRRQRVRVVQMYFIGTDGEWDYCEFTKGGILQSGPSPFIDEDERREHPFSWSSAYIDRENNRYGEIRNLLDPQDEINKRRSKALHHFTSRQTFGNQQALGRKTARELRQELSRADGHLEMAGSAQFGKDFGVIPTNDQAQGHFELMQQAFQAFEVMGPNAAMLGKKEGNESGRAIQAQQQGGSIQVGPIIDALRELDMETYRKVWRRIRQFWTGQTWVRVTDEMENLKWVEINKPKMQPVLRPALDPATGQAVMSPVMDPATGQPAMQAVIDPATGQPVMENAVAELEVDIEMSDAPDMGTLQQEEFTNLVELAKIGVVFPPKVYLAASNHRKKGELIRMLDEQSKPSPMAEAAQRIQIEGAAAEVAETKSRAELNMAKAREAMTPDMQAPQAPEIPVELQSMKTLAEIGKIEADTEQSRASAFKTTQEARLAPEKAAQEARDRQADRQSREQQFRQKATQAA